MMKNYRQRLVLWTSSLFLMLASTNCNTLFASDSPQIGSDSNSNIVSVWRTYNSSTNISEIRSSVYSSGTRNWSTFLNPISPATNSQSPLLAVDTSGNAICIWTGEDPETQNSAVQFALYLVNTGTWSSSFTLSPANESASSDYQIKFDANGIAHCVWSSYTDADQVIYAASIDLEGNFERKQIFPIVP